MKKVIITGPRRVESVDAPDPQPLGDWVVVKVLAAPLCTEWKAYVAGRRCEQLGHEAAGEIVAVDTPGAVRVGDRVVVMPQTPCGACALCNAGDYIYCEHCLDFQAIHGTRDGSATVAQYLLKPSWLLLPVPDSLSIDKASLACCGLGPSYGAFDAAGLTEGQTVLITGAGPVGLGAIVNARFRGCRVLVAESVPWRKRLAEQMGATVVDASETNAASCIRELTGGTTAFRMPFCPQEKRFAISQVLMARSKFRPISVANGLMCISLDYGWGS